MRPESNPDDCDCAPTTLEDDRAQNCTSADPDRQADGDHRARAETTAVRHEPFLRRDALLLASVVLLALVIRVVYVLQLRSSPLFEHPVLDAELHDRWARTLADGESLFKGAYFRAPLYPWFLSIIYRISGPDYLLPRLVQAVMGALSCGLLYLIGRDTFGRAVGALAGFAAATYWTLIYFDAELLLESLSIFLNLLATWLVFRASRAASPLPWAASGLAWGLSAINRPNVLVLMPLLAIWIVVQHRSRPRFAWSRAALFCAACAIPILPITIRNYVVGKDFVLIASQAGPNFYIGNNPQSDGMSAVMPGARQTWWGGYTDWVTLAEKALGRKLKPSEVSQYYFRQAWRFMRTRPLDAFNLMFLKFQLFFYELEITNNKSLYFFTDRYTPVIRCLPLTFGAIAPFGLAGIFLARRQALRLFPLWGFVAVYTATVIAFFVTARFRIPVVPFLILFAAYAVVRLIQTVGAGQWPRLGASAIALALLWLGINRGIPQAYKHDPRSYCQVGHALLSSGQINEAMEEFQTAQTLDPRSAEVETGLANACYLQRNYDEAIKHFKRALELDPFAKVHEWLGYALAYRGRWSEAFDVMHQGLEVTPGYLDLKRKLAFISATCPYEHLRDGLVALRLAEEVRTYGPEIPETYDTLAVAYAELGRFQEAIQSAHRALELAQLQGNTTAMDEISRHLSLFEQGRPFHQPMITEEHD